MKISATLITYNEEHNIADALESLSWADEIIVVDSESTDQTAQIAKRYTDKVFIRSWPGYSAQKNFAAAQASNAWIFSLDADERVSGELRTELEELKGSEAPSQTGFELPRMAFYLGRWIKHSGWYPDYKLRLYDKRRGAWHGDYVHEELEVDGEVGRLNGNLLHYTVRNCSEHHLRLDRYTTLAASQAFAQGRKATMLSLFLTPRLVFFRSYILKLGFLDGWQGLVIAKFAEQYAFLKAAKLMEMQRKR